MTAESRKSLQDNSRGGTRTRDPGIMRTGAGVSRQALVYALTALRHAGTRRGARVWLPLWLPMLLACSPLEPQPPTAESGIRIALDCGRLHGLRLAHPPETLKFYLSPDLRTADWVEGRRIWIRQELSGEVRVYADAALHALYNVSDTPHPPIFEDCDLWPI